MLFDKIEKNFNVQTIVIAYDWKPLIIKRPPHEEMYPFWQLLYVSRGCVHILRDGKTQTIKSGELMFRPPDKKSVMIHEEDCELYLGVLDFICNDKSMEFFGTDAISLNASEQTQIATIIKNAYVFYNNYPSNTLWPEFVSSALENFLIRLYGRLSGLFSFELESYKCNTHNNVSDKINQINLILEEKRFESITIEEIASIMHESPNYLMKCYKKEMKESIIDHFLNLKLHTAMHLIMVSNMNFTEI